VRYKQPRPNPARVALRIEVTRVLGNVGHHAADPAHPQA
jgi:hypothetical protein